MPFRETMFKLLYSASRNAAKIPGGIRCRLLRHDAPRQPVTGSVFDQQVEGVLGKKRYLLLCNDGRLSLEAIFYCQEELNGIGKALEASRKYLNPNHEGNERKKRLINHDFLILRIRPGTGRVFFIKAEKVAGVDEHHGQQGIHISAIDSEGLNDKHLERCCLHRIECNIYVGLEAVLAILKVDPTYDPVHNNCWDYARRTTKSLLRACKGLASSIEEYWRLDDELRNLEGNLAGNHVSNTCQRMWAFARSKVFGTS